MNKSDSSSIRVLFLSLQRWNKKNKNRFYLIIAVLVWLFSYNIHICVSNNFSNGGHRKMSFKAFPDKTVSIALLVGHCDGKWWNETTTTKKNQKKKIE